MVKRIPYLAEKETNVNDKLSKKIQEVTNMAKEMESEEVVVFLLLIMRELVDIIVLYSDPENQPKPNLEQENSIAKEDTKEQLIESAWGLISNVDNGDWSTQNVKWKAAAVRYRSRFGTYLQVKHNLEQEKVEIPYEEQRAALMRGKK